MTTKRIGRAGIPLLVSILIAACAAVQTSSPDPQPASSQPGGPLQAPSGFPLMPGAEPLPVEESDVAGRWRSDEPGSAVYAYYLAALPAAGYRSLETAPGGSVAIMRFTDTEGTAWQLDLRAMGGPGDGTEIRLSPPRP